MLGLKRLEQVDHEIGLIRSELLTQQHHQQAAVTQRQREFRESVISELATMRNEIGQTANHLLEQAVGSRQEDLLSKMCEFEERADGRISEIQRELQPYE